MVRVDDSAAVSDRGYSTEFKFRGPVRGLPNELSMAQFSERRARRGGRVVDGSGLENRQGASPRGFESHPLRQLNCGSAIVDC